MIDFILHIDKHLTTLVAQYGNMIYAILFVIVFVETGLVVMPLLPGDSLLFVAGALAAHGSMNIATLWIILVVAAILGDTVNYFIGSYFGTKVMGRFIKKEYLEKTQHFYKEHGKKTIIIARFIPIIRTFAPFVAGVGKMHYATFFSFNVIGGLLWVSSFTFAGYFFGSIPFIKNNLTLIVLGIIGLSILPAVWHWLGMRDSNPRCPD